MRSDRHKRPDRDLWLGGLSLIATAGFWFIALAAMLTCKEDACPPGVSNEITTAEALVWTGLYWLILLAVLGAYYSDQVEKAEKEERGR